MNNQWIDMCPQCWQRLMPAMILERGFVCDDCGAYAEDLDDKTMLEIADYIAKHQAALLFDQSQPT